MHPVKLILMVALLFGGIGALSYMKPGLDDAPGHSLQTDNSGFLGDLLGGGGVVNLAAPPDRPDANPEQLRRKDFYGWKSFHPAMALADDGIARIHDAVAGYPKLRDPQTPADYRIMTSDPSCTPRPLAAGERLANVSVGMPGYETGLQVFDTRALAKDTLGWTESSLRAHELKAEKRLVGDHSVHAVDVVLTDTSAPQYLVLQHHRGGILWNIMPAPGVQIAHIAMIGPGSAINPPPGDYDIQHLATGGSCVPWVARKPRETWGMYSNPGVTNDDYETRALDRFAAYDAWFREQFGQGAEDGVVGFDTTIHLLVGPMPETPEARAPYRPIQGSTVLVQEAEFIFAGDPAAYRDFLTGLQLDLVREAVGGDLAMLFPEPMTRESLQ